jgi:ribonuclease J
MLLVTGSQGERRAASAQLSNGKFQGLELKEGDLFLFSSKTIPGNERGVIRIINQLSEKGVDVVDDSKGLYHVSGHANRPDIKAMHSLVQPQMVIPMHGEHRHLREHCKLAGESGTKSLICVNGMMAEISGNEPQIVGYIDTGRVYLDGRVQYGAMDGVVRDRIRIALNGIVVVNIVMDDEDDLLGEPWVELRGLPEMGSSDVPLSDILEEDLSQYLGRTGPKTLRDDDAIEAGLVKTARQSCLSEIGKKA